MPNRDVLIIDNYDSFTYNLVQRIGELGFPSRVIRNDKSTVSDIAALSPFRIILSPGPCTPDEAGISVELVRALAPTVPILGVCLGHQSIAQAFGGKIVRASRVMHGKASMISHDNQGIFQEIICPFQAARYHSLAVDEESLPDCFEITARTDDLNELMGIRHREYPLEGVQFHPESFLTPEGYCLLENFLT